MLWNSTSIPLPSYVRDKSKDKYVSLQSFWPSNLLIMFEKKNIYMIMCWTTPKWPSFPSNPVILCCLLIIEKAGTHFHRIYEAIYIYSQEKEKKNNCPDHKKTCQCLHKLYTFIQDFTCLHNPTLWKKMWQDIFEMMSLWCSFEKTSNCDMTNQTILLRR